MKRGRRQYDIGRYQVLSAQSKERQYVFEPNSEKH